METRRPREVETSHGVEMARSRGEEEGAGGGGSNKLALTGVVGGHENGGRDAGRAACARTWLPVVTRPGSAVDGASDCGP